VVLGALVRLVPLQGVFRFRVHELNRIDRMSSLVADFYNHRKIPIILARLNVRCSFCEWQRTEKIHGGQTDRRDQELKDQNLPNVTPRPLSSECG